MNSSLTAHHTRELFQKQLIPYVSHNCDRADVHKMIQTCMNLRLKSRVIESIGCTNLVSLLFAHV